jgi:hypothetical protein
LDEAPVTGAKANMAASLSGVFARVEIGDIITSPSENALLRNC